MKPYEFTRFYHPRLGRFMYKHKGNGIIVDNLFKPMKSVLSSVFKNVVKPMTKKALESGISHAGDKLGKKAAEKSDDMIMKKLANMRKPTTRLLSNPPSTKKTRPAQESTDMILNRLISGSGIQIKRRII